MTEKKFLKQIYLKVDVKYYKNKKLPIFHELVLSKSISKLWNFYKVALRSLVNFDPVVRMVEKPWEESNMWAKMKNMLYCVLDTSTHLKLFASASKILCLSEILFDTSKWHIADDAVKT